MKKLFNGFAWSAICALGLFSCTEKEIVDIPEVPDYYRPIEVAYDVIKPSYFMDIPVIDGHYTVVKQDDEILFITKEATALEVLNPQYSIFTRTSPSEPHYVYVPDDQIDYILPDGGSFNDANTYIGYTMYKTIMFEDTRVGSDYDYNDLIIHVQQRREGNKLRMYIHPIALGAYDQLTLGADIFLVDRETKLGKKCAEVIFSKNVRTDLFKSPKNTFVNTDHENTFNGNGELTEYVTYFVPPAEPIVSLNNSGAKWVEGSHWLEVDKKAISGKTFAINWFIINNNKTEQEGEAYKLYAVPAIEDNVQWRDQSGYPYGIISAYTRIENWQLTDNDFAGHDWINYAKEKMHLCSVYPNFIDWLEGTGNANWDNPIEENAINAIGFIRGELGLPNESKALFDMNSGLKENGYVGVWNNGNPDESKIPVARRD